MLPERTLYSRINTIKNHSPNKFVTKSLCPAIELTTGPVFYRFLGML